MPVNGVDQSHQTVPAPPAPIENLGGPMELPEHLKLKLKEPLPAAAVSPNPIKPGLSAIKVIYVVERLNDVFGLNGWHVDNEIVETGQMIVVRATLSIPKYAIAIEQFGGNDNPDRGDAYKGACTDALSKCASYLGSHCSQAMTGGTIYWRFLTQVDQERVLLRMEQQIRKLKGEEQETSRRRSAAERLTK
jgi:hypothetical protein